MPVELYIRNLNALLAPGMYPTVLWPNQAVGPILLLPASSIVNTTERTFVIRYHHGRAQWVDVKKRSSIGDRVEIQGNLDVGDRIIGRATDEIRDGALLQAR